MTILVQVPRDDMISISDLMADFIPTVTPAQREQLQSVVLAFGLSYDYCTPATQADPSPRNLAFTDLPFNPMALTICGSPGTKSIA